MLVPGIVPIYMGEGDDHILLREIVDDEAKEEALDPNARGTQASDCQLAPGITSKSA